MSGGTPRGRDLAIIEAVASGLTNKQTAAQVGCSTSTVHRVRRAHRDKITALADERWAAHAHAAGRAVPRALATLLQLMDSPHDAVRLGAAKAMLDTAVRLRESQDLAERVAELERWAA